ncbi:hypothetical protein RSOLAG1IB_05359 [Rhizoctonia solani AG-1 IB]|uniref:RBR-type E3 ubiquitin transferase n=1 Tax=Thanatephorus cucumeris (strain AG1-IB / isolate 7/3/14) TaxID=1108050 RepID=A0A0B7G031_THACB|nr:hypothetical protein RSOLAG1IB_05359 [Rhizoctonia solani AG-1 IB]
MSLRRSGEGIEGGSSTYNAPLEDLATNPISDRTRGFNSHQRTDTSANHIHSRTLDTPQLENYKRLKRGRCSICLEPMDSSLWTRPSALCTHEPKACEPCFKKYIINAIQEGLTVILCPDVECRKEMQHGDILTCVREEEQCLSRYNTLLAQRNLEKQPNFVWCANPTCGHGLIHDEGATSPLVTCHHCHTSTCFVHHVPWHDNLTCDEYSQYEKVRASEDFINMHAKRCPNTGCNRPIEKVNGCDHITCYPPGGCGHEFCWLCFADYKPILQEGQHRHNPNCSHYVDVQSHDHDFPIPRRRARRRVDRRRRIFIPVDELSILDEDAAHPPTDVPLTRMPTPPLPLELFPISPTPHHYGPFHPPVTLESLSPNLRISSNDSEPTFGLFDGEPPSRQAPRYPEVDGRLPETLEGSSVGSLLPRRRYRQSEPDQSLPSASFTPCVSSTSRLEESQIPKPPFQEDQPTPEVRRACTFTKRNRAASGIPQSERQPSSIPDFESEVLLDFMAGRV